MARAAEQELRGPNQANWNVRLEEERPNLVAALEWSFGPGATGNGLEIVAGLRDFWFYQGHDREMGHWVGQAMAEVADAGPHLQAGVYLTAGFHSYLGYRSGSDALFHKAVELYEQTGDPARQALALIWTAGSRELIGTDIDGARHAVNEGLELARRVGATAHEAQALNMLGELERAQGNYELAWNLQSEGLELSREVGELRRVAMVTHNLGLIAHHLGDDGEAERLLRESLELSLDQQFTAQTAHSLLSLGEQIALRGDLETGALAIGHADSVFARMGIRPQPADEPDYIRIHEFVEREMGSDAYRDATTRGAALDLDQAVSLVRAS
jgi:tetratricopeptide (TPR) repeat protein